MYFDIPRDPAKAKPIMTRFMQENAAVAGVNSYGRRRPDPPRSAIAQGGSLEILLTWNAPQNINGLQGFNVYFPDEKTRILNINDPFTRQVKLKMPSGKTAGLYISSYNGLLESIKVPVVGTPNSDQYVVTGTGGGTGGTTPPTPPGYPNEPSGGQNKKQTF